LLVRVWLLHPAAAVVRPTRLYVSRSRSAGPQMLQLGGHSSVHAEYQHRNRNPKQN